MQNPDWSRESMKTILAWGWVSPTGQDHVGRRKDGTHDRMAYDLGLGTWVQAVKAGWVRYILFSDGHMGLTLIINPGTLSAARKLVDRPEVATVSFEWIVDGRIQQSGVLSAKEAVVAIRAKGREKNPPYHGGGDDAGTVFSWGFLSPKGRVIDGAKEEYHAVTTHDKLARSEGLGRSEAAALSKGYVRYLTSRFGTTGAKVEIGATIAEPWAAPAKVLWGYIERDLGGKSAGLMYLDFVEANGKQHYASIGLLGEERMKAVLMAVARGEDPANVTERERRRSAGRERNPYDLSTTIYDYGFISPDGTIYRAQGQDGSHSDVANRIAHDLGLKVKVEAEDTLFRRGWLRFILEQTHELYLDCHSIKKSHETIKLALASELAFGSILIEDYENGFIAASNSKLALVKLKEYVEEKTRNPLTLTPTHRDQARSNKFNILVEMTPMEFLRLTTVDDAQIAEIIDDAKPLSTYNEAAASGRNIIPCFLTLDIASGKAKVTGHEGRHRAGALLNAGEDGVGQPVYLRIQDAHPGQAEKMLEKLPGGRKAWMWDTTYLWGWDELPEMLVGQFRATVKVPKSRLKVIEPYVQERAKKARGL